MSSAESAGMTGWAATVADVVLARELAAAAGQKLLAIREQADPSDVAGLRRAGDEAAHALLSAALASARPDDAVLSEEAADDRRRLDADRVWIIDPLDGTREYAEGRHDWAVHVALWERGALVAGAVALPALDTVLTSDPPPAVPPAERARWRLGVSRTRPPSVVGALAESLDLEVVAMGSAGYKAAAVIRGEIDVYVHAGGQYEWDSAAPVAVALAAGLHASRVDGAALRYNQPDVRLSDLVVCRRELAGRVLDALSEVIACRA
jgi:3'(2'), 5'-bisphosphate nucleotidase